jgi:hypothetical protein
MSQTPKKENKSTNEGECPKGKFLDDPLSYELYKLTKEFIILNKEARSTGHAANQADYDCPSNTWLTGSIMHSATQKEEQIESLKARAIQILNIIGEKRARQITRIAEQNVF